MNFEDTAQSEETYTELTAQMLHQTLSKLKPPSELPERFEVSPNTERELRTKLSPTLYSPPSPNTVLASCMGMKIIVNGEMPDGTIVIVYRTPKGEQKELKVLNLKF